MNDDLDPNVACDECGATGGPCLDVRHFDSTTDDGPIIFRTTGRCDYTRADTVAAIAAASALSLDERGSWHLNMATQRLGIADMRRSGWTVEQYRIAYREAVNEAQLAAKYTK